MADEIKIRVKKKYRQRESLSSNPKCPAMATPTTGKRCGTDGCYACKN